MTSYFIRTLFMLLLSFLLGFSLAEHLHKKQFLKPQPECTHEHQAPKPQDDQARAVG